MIKMEVIMNLSIIEKSAFFDKDYYVKNYRIPDNMSPAEHYSRYGYKLCYNPSERFSTSGYYYINTDVLKAGVNPLEHYETVKFSEHRKWLTDIEVIDNTYVFNPYFYINKNMDKNGEISEKDAIRHYLDKGWKIGLSFNDTIDLSEYSSSLTNEEKECIPLLHYIIFYCIKNDIEITKNAEYWNNIKIIKKSAFFDKKFYCKKYDICRKIDPARHYYEYGAKIYNDPSEDFSTYGYVHENRIGIHENALVHYEKNMNYGGIYRISDRPFIISENDIINLSKKTEYKISGQEDKLYELFLNCSEIQRNDFLLHNSDSFFVNTLSELRENSVEWIPIDSEDNVLIIGAGYGEIVSTLARKSKSVVCFDSEITKAAINKARNRNYDNIKYYVADNAEIFYSFLDLDKFDYIFIFESFERAEKYYPGEADPQFKMLMQAKKHLSDDGIIVLACDNTYAFKYFNGSLRSEDSQYFETITNVSENNTGKTFTKNEIDNYIERIGLNRWHYYYPYPDYHIPMSVYRDDYSIKNGEIGEPDYTWEKNKIRLFEEKKAYVTASERGCLDIFSNSFIVTIAKTPEIIQKKIGNILYVKYSNDRNEAFRIKTEIRENKGGTKTVNKIPLSKFSNTHIKNINKNFLKLSKSYSNHKYSFNVCQYDGYKTEFEFVEGDLLYDRIVKLALTEDYNAIFSEFDDLYNMLNKNSVNFIPSRNFKEIFGNVSLSGKLKACAVSDIDLILQNILIDSCGKYIILDYEWTFDFSVPVLYILFRSIFYLEKDSSGVISKKITQQLYSRYGFNDKIIREFIKMEENFQKYVLLGHVPVRAFEKKDQTKIFNNSIKVFEDYGDGFNESLGISCNAILNPNGIINTKLFINEGIKCIKFSPCKEKCIIKVIKADDSNCNILDYKTNGDKVGDDCWLFKTSEPFIIFNSLESVNQPQKISDKTNFINICLEITIFTKHISEII